MDYFWAFVKTLGLFFCMLLVAILAMAASVLAVPAVEIIGDFLWDNGKVIGQFIYLLFMGAMFLAVFFSHLDKERKKRLTTVN